MLNGGLWVEANGITHQRQDYLIFTEKSYCLLKHIEHEMSASRKNSDLKKLILAKAVEMDEKEASTQNLEDGSDEEEKDSGMGRGDMDEKDHCSQTLRDDSGKEDSESQTLMGDSDKEDAESQTMGDSEDIQTLR